MKLFRSRTKVLSNYHFVHYLFSLSHRFKFMVIPTMYLFEIREIKLIFIFCFCFCFFFSNYAEEMSCCEGWPYLFHGVAKVTRFHLAGLSIHDLELFQGNKVLRWWTLYVHIYDHSSSTILILVVTLQWEKNWSSRQNFLMFVGYVGGKLNMSELLPEVVYEIVYVVKLTKGAYGWSLPIILKTFTPRWKSSRTPS